MDTEDLYWRLGNWDGVHVRIYVHARTRPHEYNNAHAVHACRPCIVHACYLIYFGNLRLSTHSLQRVIWFHYQYISDALLDEPNGCKYVYVTHPGACALPLGA